MQKDGQDKNDAGLRSHKDALPYIKCYWKFAKVLCLDTNIKILELKIILKKISKYLESNENVLFVKICEA